MFIAALPQFLWVDDVIRRGYTISTGYRLALTSATNVASTKDVE